ncbi:MAG TPA: DUF2782 domain-containing protein [Methylothermaceae bacterium]|nr:DUF2782 domain-containing protein [Methylothermaceae bacterium]
MGQWKAFVLAIAVGAVEAAEEAPPQLEPLPEPELEQETLQPEVIIRKRGENVIEEYRVGGRIYMIKVIPPVGPPYYLIDTDGDSIMDMKRSDLEEGVRIHQWRILEW